MQNSDNIANEDNQQKSKAFSLRGTRNNRFMNRKWPRKTEAKEHKNFEDAHTSNQLLIE